MATILIVDDDPVTRIFLEELLHQEEYHVFMAADGQEALIRLDEGRCDLVLMDIQMPVLDGYETTIQIKTKMKHEWFVPVIFLTSVESDRELVRCLECGGDDFLNKPPNPIILKARIKAWLQRAELANRLAADRQDVEDVILKMRQDDQFDLRGLRILMTPLEKTNGDLVLSASRSDGVQHLMVGDFTGHGLAAAICGPLVSDIFYRMTRQDFPLQEIILQINETIHSRLPTNMFLAAAFLELNRVEKKTRIWNANLPTVMLLRSGKIESRFLTSLPFLGILKNLADNVTCVQCSLEEGDRIYLFSDGSVETYSSTGDFFGEEGMVHFLEDLAGLEKPMENLLIVLAKFRDGREPKDDITLVEVSLAVKVSIQRILV